MSVAVEMAVAISKVEMIGLTSEIAFIESAFYYMGIQDFSFAKLLERKIQAYAVCSKPSGSGLENEC
jgi:glutamate formiminotransferase